MSKTNLLLASTFVILNILDYYLTSNILNKYGVGAELNASIRTMLTTYSLAVIKIVGSILIAGLLLIFPRKYRRSVTRILVALDVAFILITLWNTYQWRTII